MNAQLRQRLKTTFSIINLLFGALIAILAVLGVDAMPLIAAIGGVAILLMWGTYWLMVATKKPRPEQST